MKRARAEDGAGPPPKRANVSTNPGMPKVQDALGYLEKVKARFAHQPMVYNQFLDIMKDFKLQAIDTEGVIKRVKQLFKGNRQLILGFNQFLPPGFKIELEADPEQAAAMAAANVQKQQATSVEFNHAVNYVAKIKHRFKDRPEVYSEFLEILHEYQARRSIDESAAVPQAVYQRVRQLFGNQPDLMDEFKFFLPELQQAEQAARTGRRGGVHKAAHPQQAPPRPTRPMGRIVKGGRKDAQVAAATAATEGKQDGTVVPGQALQRTVRYPAGTEREQQVLERIKQVIPKENWENLIKALYLWTNRITTRAEMMRMMEECLGDKNGELLERFKVAIGFDDYEERQVQGGMPRMGYFAFVGTVDLSRCREVTPSYRELPRDAPIAHCSGRTPLCDEVLNDYAISTATGSEDYSFKATRKNQYEEALFRCEDERYELDMLIEQNGAAIRVLEPVVQQAKGLPQEDAKRIRLNDNVDILHIRAIARIYGDQGYDVISMLNECPAIAAPIILQRLKQKDEEWRRLRTEMRGPWRRITEQNYQRSLDHRSFYFKQEDKKKRGARVLIEELKQRHSKLQQGLEPEAELTPAPGFPSGTPMRLSSGSLTPQLQPRAAPKAANNEGLENACFKFNFPDQGIHKLLLDVIARVAAAISTEAEQAKLHLFWSGFAHHFFNVKGGMPPQKAAAYARSQSKTVRSREAKRSSRSQDTASATSETPSASPDIHDSDADIDEGHPHMSNEDEDHSENGHSKAEDEDAASQPGKGRKALKDEPPRNWKKEFSEEEETDPTSISARARKLQAAQKKTQVARMESEEGVVVSSIDDTGSHASSVGKALGGVPSKTASSPQQQQPPFLGFSAFAASICAPDPDAPAAASAHTSVKQEHEGGLVKPTKLSLRSFQPMEEGKGRRHTRPSKLLLGNYALYVWFRLYQMLYDRLLTAKQLAHKAKRRVRQHDKLSKKKALNTPEERYERFCELLFDLLEQEGENAKFRSNFEDECRNLLGASSYVLFTVDHLARQLLKQTLALFRSPRTMTALSLYQAELCRARGANLAQVVAGQQKVPETAAEVSPERSAQLLRLYQTNAQTQIGEDIALQIEFFEDSRDLGISVLEPIPASEHKTVTQDWYRHVDHLLHDKGAASAKPFLLRNLRKVGAAQQQQQAPTAAAAAKAGEIVHVHNTLAIRYHSRTLKALYEPDSYDVFFRLRFKRKLQELGIVAPDGAAPGFKVTEAAVKAYEAWKLERRAIKAQKRQKKAQRFAEHLRRRLAEITAASSAAAAAAVPQPSVAAVPPSSIPSAAATAAAVGAGGASSSTLANALMSAAHQNLMQRAAAISGQSLYGSYPATAAGVVPSAAQHGQAAAAGSYLEQQQLWYQQQAAMMHLQQQQQQQQRYQQQQQQHRRG